MRAPVKSAAAGLLVLVALGATLPVWKPAAKKFKWFVVATNIYQDTLRRTGIRRDQISQPDYAGLPKSAVPSYLSRINTTFADYEKYGGLTPARVRGARVLEIGPGETLGVALRFIGSGAAHVVAADKFVPLETSQFHRDLYRELIRGMSPEEQADVRDALVLDRGVEFNPTRVAYLYGRGIEDASTALPDASFDIVVSNAVLEEVYDLDRLFGAVDRLLKPGGRQVHVIDLGDYGMFSKHGFHPLEFLTIPDGVYRYMVEASGQPNRRSLDYYRSKMASLGYRAEIYRTWVLGEPAHLREYRTALEYGRDYTDTNIRLVQSIRSRLLPRYQQLSDDDLLTRSILLVADKPGETRSARSR